MISTTGQTITLPVATSVAAGGCYNVQTVGFPLAIQPNAADGINGSPIGTVVNLGADVTTAITSSGASGTGAWSVSLGQRTPFNVGWKQGTDLSTTASYVARNGPSVLNVPLITCNIQVAAGTAMTMDVYATASGTAPASGTKLNTTSCNLNSASNTEQVMSPALATIPANATIWAVIASGTATASSGGVSIITK